MTMGYTGSLNEWIKRSVDELKLHLAELNYSEGTISRLDATWKELIAYCEAHEPRELSVDLERKFVWERYGCVLGDKDASQNVNRAIHMLNDYLQYGMVFKQSSVVSLGQRHSKIIANLVCHFRRDLSRLEGLPQVVCDHIIVFSFPASNDRVPALCKKKLLVSDRGIALVSCDQIAAVGFLWIFHIVCHSAKSFCYCSAFAAMQGH